MRQLAVAVLIMIVGVIAALTLDGALINATVFRGADTIAPALVGAGAIAWLVGSLAFTGGKGRSRTSDLRLRRVV